MQKIGAQYMLKKFADQVMAPPPPPAADPEPEVELRPSGPDTIAVHDENGNEIGTAHRVDVEVYVVTHRGRPEAALARSLEAESTQVMVQREGGRITGIIYVPEPWDEPRGVATRADDI